jgi:heme-degrading monooxygenase HmoA
MEGHAAPVRINYRRYAARLMRRARQHRGLYSSLGAEFISYSEWETEADIERYTNSAAHKQIVNHTRGVKGATAVVKLYDLVN